MSQVPATSLTDILGPQVEPRQALRDALGYLNFSSGRHDPRFACNLNTLALGLEGSPGWSASQGQAESAGPPVWRHLQRLLSQEIEASRRDAEAGQATPFRELDQAERVVALTFDRLFPAYRRHHADLLGQQREDWLLNPFFVARACEAVLRQGGPWHEAERIVPAALAELNDYIGYRPVAVLHTSQKLEPYPHERVAPIPLYERGAGIAAGPHRGLIEHAMRILHETDAAILERFWFDLACFEELGCDPRPYDFDHPANKRPNYQFGTWDLEHLDGRGNYRRLVLQQTMLDALLDRATRPSELPAEELLVEAGTVLAGAILMAAAITGTRPDAHDSSVSLHTLLPEIAAGRDDFYRFWIERLPDRHAARLRAEAESLHQPFAGARQDLNRSLSRLRASQMQHVQLAQLFARMGFPSASRRQAQLVPAASARMMCQALSLLATARNAIEQHRWSQATPIWDEARDVVERAIQCGALPDPWNILGFQAQFPLYPAVENTVHDHRLDLLAMLVRQMLSTGALLHAAAASQGDVGACRDVSQRIWSLATWWDKFASTEVSSVDGFSGREAAESSDSVAKALAARRQAGSAAGDIAFWRKHAAEFHSPKAYALVVESLLDQRDYGASLGLLMQWLGEARDAPLADGPRSFFDLAVRWLRGVHGADSVHRATGADAMPADRRWNLTRRFFDVLEANADEYWEIPDFAPLTGAPRPNRASPPGQEPSPEEGQAELLDAEHEDAEHDERDEPLYGAAYEGMSYRDTTRDGVESDMLSGGADATRLELGVEAERISDRLAFLAALARLWKIAALAAANPEFDALRSDSLAAWRERALQNRDRLLRLLESVNEFRIPRSTGSQESLHEYDRLRSAKISLLARCISTCVETAMAAMLLRASETESAPGEPAWVDSVVRTLHSLLHGDAEAARQRFSKLIEDLHGQPILYVGLEKQGDPCKIVKSQTLKHSLLYLLRGFPAQGLLNETGRLIAAAHELERRRPAGAGAITEFDRLFDAGFQSLVDSLVTLADAHPEGGDLELVDSLQKLTEFLLHRWIEHSRSIRLAALERVADDSSWRRMVEFVERYGHDLFTPSLFNVGRLRAILHQGVDAWLKSLQENPPDEPPALLAALDVEVPLAEAADRLSMVFEAVVENFAEYRDYTATTTQSDRGEGLYVLLDFLRLKAHYDRFQWTIKPVALAHEILVRRNRHAAAEMWRRGVAERTAEAADWHLKRLEELVRKYGVRLATVADRLAERFVRPLTMDRIRALVGPAVEQARRGGPCPAFDALERDLQEFTERPTGAGFDTPPWLQHLTAEVEQVHVQFFLDEDDRDFVAWLPRRVLTWEDVRRQLSSEDAGGFA